MSSFWQQIPFVRILFPFVLGILIAENNWLSTWRSLILLTLTSVSLFLWDRLNKKIMRDHFYGILFSILFFLLGFFCLNLKKVATVQTHFSLQKTSYLFAQIAEKPQQNSNGFKAEAFVITGIDSLHKEIKAKGKLLLYFKNTGKADIPFYGDQIILKSNFHDFSDPKNPGAFDFKKYMAHKGIYQAAYLQKNDWFFAGQNQGSTWMKWVIGSQEFIQESLHNNLKNAGDIAISEALLYGYDKDMDAAIIDAYTKTGTLHVLAVSGMHVGMIFMLLGLFLKPLEKRKSGKIMAAIVQLIGIWAYSLLCGFTPSILRATVMFSFVIIGKQIKRGGNTFNSLAASAQFLLLFDPNMLFNVGFQLSYAAVLGILGFYPRLYFLFEFKHRIADEIWKIIAVSIAAQTLTLPMSIFYFHQLPNYFLLANLLIIPLTSLIIYLGILLLAISWWTIVAKYLGLLIGFFIHLCNSIAQWIAALPYSYTDGLFWTPLGIACFYLSLICMLIYFSKRDLFQLKIVLGMVLLLQMQNLYSRIQNEQQEKILIYHCQNHCLLQYIHGTTAYTWIDSLGYISSKNYRQNIANNMLVMNIQKCLYKELGKNNTSIQIGSNRNLFYWQTTKIPISQHIAILLIAGNLYQDLAKMLAANKVDRIVLNPSIGRRKQEEIKKIALKMKIPLHAIAESGAFELSL